MNNQLSNSNKADMEMIDEMQQRIDAEMKKPVKIRDYDLIDRLTSAIYDAVSGKEINISAAMNELHACQQKHSAKKQSNRWIKPVAYMAAVLVVILGLNTWSIYSYGRNISQLAYQLLNGFSPADLAFSQEFEYSDDDPYGIRAECEKYIPDPLVPNYIPEQFTQPTIEVDDSNKQTRINIQFNYKKQYIAIYYNYLKTDELFHNTTTNVTADDPNHIFAETIFGHNVIMKWEDDSFEAVFVDGHTMYRLGTLHVSQDEAYTILRSFFAR